MKYSTRTGILQSFCTHSQEQNATYKCFQLILGNPNTADLIYLIKVVEKNPQISRLLTGDQLTVVVVAKQLSRRNKHIYDRPHIHQIFAHLFQSNDINTSTNILTTNFLCAVFSALCCLADFHDCICIFSTSFLFCGETRRQLYVKRIS